MKEGGGGVWRLNLLLIAEVYDLISSSHYLDREREQVPDLSLLNHIFPSWNLNFETEACKNGRNT